MPWHIVRTKPQHEIKSAKIIKKLGLEVYCPLITEVRQWSDRKKTVTVPLFKSYLFVNLYTRDKNTVYQAPGVLNFVYWLKKPAIARDEEIETIKAWLDNDTLDNYKIEGYKPGDEIEIKAGRLANRKAIIKEIGAKKLKLILPDLGWTLTADIKDMV